MTITNGTVAMRDGHDLGQPAAALAIRPGQDFWTDKQRAALSVLGIRNATSADLAVFLHYCQKTGLDPFSRQIYMICRREKQGDQWTDKQTIQVGIDGFRVIRDRIAARLGIEVEYEDTIWYDDQGREHAVWLSDAPPAACRVVVLKNGRRFPAVLRTSGYAAVNKDGALMAQWKTQPDHMIEKCAEAYALRRAFPHDLGGIYLEDEMPPADIAPPRPQRVTAAEIVRQPETPGPADAEPARSEPAGPGHPKAHPAGKAALERLDVLLAQLQLGPDPDVLALQEWLCGEPWTATVSQVKTVTDYLKDHLETAKGDTGLAFDAIWAQYRLAGPQEGVDGES
jgi:phage recombination protein Bet